MEAKAQNIDSLITKVKEKKLSNGLTVLFYPYEREKVALSLIHISEPTRPY